MGDSLSFSERTPSEEKRTKPKVLNSSMLSCSTGANGRFVPYLVLIEIVSRRSSSRFPVDAVGILSGTTPGWDKETD